MATDVSLVVDAGADRSRGVPRPGVHLLDVSRRADSYAAVERVRLAVPTGSVCALTGTAGSVDTLMGLLSTRLAPHAGQVLIDGHETVLQTRAARASLGYVGAEPVDWGTLTVAEALDLAARAHAPGHRVDRGQRRRIGDLVLAMDLPGRSRVWCADLDPARSRRLSLACALVHAPRVLLLHDPLRGVESAEQDELAALCRHLAARGMTIVLGTASLGREDAAAAEDESEEEDADIAFAARLEVHERLEGFADRVLTMQDGLLVAGRDLSGVARARRWRVVSWDGAALLTGLDRLGVEHDLIAGGVPMDATEADDSDDSGDSDGSGGSDVVAASIGSGSTAGVRRDLDSSGFATFGARGAHAADPSADEAPEQTVVEVAIAQDADAASLLAALVAAGVPVHGFLPPASPERAPAAARPRAITAGHDTRRGRR